MADKEEVDALLDRLLAGRRPEEIIGGDGLLDTLTTRLMERALEGELTDPLGYDRHAVEGRDGGNSRNGVTSKRVKTGSRESDLEGPRDRDSTFEPQLVRNLSGFAVFQGVEVAQCQSLALSRGAVVIL